MGTIIEHRHNNITNTHCRLCQCVTNHYSESDIHHNGHLQYIDKYYSGISELYYRSSF